MLAVKMLVSAVTDVGRTRHNNEDAFTIRDLASGRRLEQSVADEAIDVLERGVLLALSDGMGGAQAGEVASALVLESLHAALADETKDPIHDQLEEAVKRANQKVFEAARTENRKGMAATLTAMFVRGDEAYIAEVGDSRAYLLRTGRLRQITRDQSLVQLLVDQGVMSAEEARTSSSKNVILQAVGLSDKVRVAIARLRLRRGDRVLLCSDGVSNAITDPELLQIVMQSNPRQACETMIALANDRGGNDNQTAIVADLDGEGLPLPDEFESVTSTYEVLQAYEGSIEARPAEIRRSPIPTSSVAPPALRPATPERSPREPDAPVRVASTPAQGPPGATGSQPRTVMYPPAPRTRPVGLIVSLLVIAIAAIAIVLALMFR